MAKIAFKDIWRIIKIVAVIQILNAIADYAMWAFYGYQIPSWTIATLSIGYLIVIFAVKQALENEKCEKMP